MSEKIKYYNPAGTYRLLPLSNKRFGRIIKPNETFWACPEEIPPAIKDRIRLLEEPQPPTQDPVAMIDERSFEERTGPDGVVAVMGNYKIRLRSFLASEAIGWYEILNKDGKVISEVPLRYAEALDFVTKLS